MMASAKMAGDGRVTAVVAAAEKLARIVVSEDDAGARRSGWRKKIAVAHNCRHLGRSFPGAHDVVAGRSPPPAPGEDPWPFVERGCGTNAARPWGICRGQSLAVFADGAR